MILGMMKKIREKIMKSKLDKDIDLVSAYKVQVESSKTTNKPQRNEAIGHEYHCCRRFFHCMPNVGMIVVHENLHVQC